MANEIKLTKTDRFWVFWNSQFLQASWNYERMQNVGWAFALAPALKKLYKSKEDRAAALKRHLEFFNTHPYLAAPILGVEMSLEESRANGAPVTDQTIQGVKVGMMGPLAGVGDPVFWATARPILGAFTASFALSGSWLGPILFFVVWQIIRMGFLWFTQEMGYRQGEAITNDLSGGLLQKITVGASVLGMFIMGVLVPRWTTMNFPAVVSNVKVDKDAQVDFTPLVHAANHGTVSAGKIRDVISSINAGNSVTPTKTTTLGDIFDQLTPGLMPLLLTLLCVWLLRKKVSPIVIILALFVVGILAYWAGILGA